MEHYIGVGDGFISNMNNFYRVINEYEPGTEVVFKVKRSNTDKEIELKVVKLKTIKTYKRTVSDIYKKRTSLLLEF